MNKQNKISLILGVLVLTVLIVTSSFAFFQITNTGNTETNTSFTGSLEDIESYGTASLSGPNNKLHIKIKASDMAKTKAGTHYYATINPDLDYELDKQNHLISTASIKNGEGNEDVAYECTSDLLIEASGSLVTDNVINAKDGNIYFGGSGSTIDPTEISLKDIIDAQVDGGYKKQVKYKITGNGEATLTTDIDIINRDDDQNDIAGKQIDLTITNKNLVCTVKGLQEKAYATFENLTYEYYDYPIVTASFVNYIPSDLETENIVKHIDISDTESGTKERSVIAWFEKTNKVDDDYGEPLYNLYIGSESEIYVKDLSYAFWQMYNLQEIAFDNLNTSETTDMSYMFSECSNLTSLDLSNFDTSQVTNMTDMFSGASANLPFQDWPNFVTTNVEYMGEMFQYYEGTTLDLSNFDTSKVTYMEDMFNGCENLKELKLGGWNLGALEGGNPLKFYNLDTKITFGKNFGAGATDMSEMFYGYKGTELDLSTFDTSNVINMNSMFSGINANITFPSGFGSAATDMSDMFFGYEGTTLDLSTFDTSSVTDMSSMFEYCSNLTTLDLSTFDTSSVTNMHLMFSSINANITFPSGFGSAATDMSNMFDGYEETTLDLSTFDTSSVTDMHWMFSGINANITFPSGFGSAATDMSYMFDGYEGTTLDLSAFDTSSVTNMRLMFSRCSNLTELDLSTFDTSQVTDMSYMFNDCRSLVILDLSGFTFDNIISGSYASNYGNYETFSNVPSNCKVKIKSSQQEMFESKFPYDSVYRLFTPTYVD